jgi:hypothetical protein
MFASDPLDNLRKSVFVDALSWSEEDGTAKFVGGPSNRVVSFDVVGRPIIFLIFPLCCRIQRTHCSTSL